MVRTVGNGAGSLVFMIGRDAWQNGARDTIPAWTARRGRSTRAESHSATTPGGMDDVIGSLNNSTSKSPTVQKVEHSPL